MGSGMRSGQGTIGWRDGPGDWIHRMRERNWWTGYWMAVFDLRWSRVSLSSRRFDLIVVGLVSAYVIRPYQTGVIGISLIFFLLSPYDSRSLFDSYFLCWVLVSCIPWILSFLTDIPIPERVHSLFVIKANVYGSQMYGCECLELLIFNLGSRLLQFPLVCW